MGSEMCIRDSGKGKGETSSWTNGAAVPTPPPKTPLTAEQRAKTPCPYFQTKWNGRVCNRENCGFSHEVYRSWNAYAKSFIPWEWAAYCRLNQETNTRGGSPSPGRRGGKSPGPGGGKGKRDASPYRRDASPGGKDRTGKGGKGKTDKSTAPAKPAFAMRANWQSICQKCLECPGQTSPDGDGSCTKIHMCRAEALRHIAEDKKRLKEEKSKAKEAEQAKY